MQQELKKESALIIYDTSKKSKFHGFGPYQLLMYMTQRQPWAIAMTVQYGDHGPLAFVDREWSRDSHAVLVKHPNALNQKDTRKLINILALKLKDEEIEMILKRMVKRMASIRGSSNDDERKEMDRIIDIEARNENGRFDLKRKKEILHYWFSDIIIGPLLITRTLGLQELSHSSEIMDPLTTRLRLRMNPKFYEFDVDHITILDDLYFLIPGGDAHDMQWPPEVRCAFVAVTEDEQDVKSETFKVLESFDEKYVNQLKSKETVVRTSVCMSGSDKYLQCEYGGYVFLGINNVLFQIFNSTKFNYWAGSTNVKLDLWFGRNEKDKIHDHRVYTEMIKMLKLENLKLKTDLSEMKREKGKKDNEPQDEDKEDHDVDVDQDKEDHDIDVDKDKEDDDIDVDESSVWSSV